MINANHARQRYPCYRIRLVFLDLQDQSLRTPKATSPFLPFPLFNYVLRTITSGGSLNTPLGLAVITHATAALE